MTVVCPGGCRRGGSVETGSPSVGRRSCTAAPTSSPRRAAAATSSSATPARPGSSSTAMRRGRFPSGRRDPAFAPGAVAVGPASSAPRGFEQADGLLDLIGERTLQHDAGPVVLHRVDLADHRRAAAAPQGPGPSSAAPTRVMPRGGHGGASRRVDLARVAQAFRHREDGRQRDLRRPACRRRARARGGDGHRGLRAGARRWRRGGPGARASSGPTWPVSPSSEFSPSSTRS